MGNVDLSKIKRRINILKGQLDGLFKMVENERYCIDILTQSSAIQQSLKGLDSLILERHLKTHIREQFKKEPDKATQELLRVFKQSRKTS